MIFHMKLVGWLKVQCVKFALYKHNEMEIYAVVVLVFVAKYHRGRALREPSVKPLLYKHSGGSFGTIC